MRTNALYFPYIEPPEDEWLYLMLLYWNKLSSIVPSEYVDNPQRFSPHMSALMAEGLVNPVVPQGLIDDKEEFGKPFLGFISRRVRARKTQLRDDTTVRRVPIHVEKLGPVADELVELNLATYTGYPWYEMDSWVANAFMSYLASFIGSLPEVDSAPITNNEICFSLLGGYPRKFTGQRIIQRYEVLKGIFPFPNTGVNLHEVIEFKEKYGDELARFRDHIEGLCIELSNIRNQDDREEKKQIEVRRLQQEIDHIASRMQGTWHEIVFLDILPVLSGGASSLPTVIYQSIERRKNRALLHDHPLAYGALLKRQWPHLQDRNRRWSIR